MEQDFPVPKEFQERSSALFAKDTISEREYIDLGLLATTLINTHWDNRQGMAYHLAGAWLKYKNISQDNLLNQIGGTFGELELPDHLIGENEDTVREEWHKVEKLAREASEKFPQA